VSSKEGMNTKLFVLLPILAMVAIVGTAPAFAQTTTSTSTSTSTTHHFHGFRGGFRGGLGIGLGATIINPLASSSVCPNPLASIPVQTSTGTYCLSEGNTANDLNSGIIAQPSTEIIVAGHYFGGFHHFHR
jgi:hypothetical protein